MQNKIVVIGGGAAGLMAAVSAAQQGAAVTVLEKMGAIGRKLQITGKGRCNITNVAEISDFIKNMPGNGPFLYSSFHQFNNQDVITFFEQQGVSTKVERGGRVFPVSDKAADVVAGFQRRLDELGVKVMLRQTVKQIHVENGLVHAVMTQDTEYPADAVIIATGGASYPGTGSAGEGFLLAQTLGHSIVTPKPSLVPLTVEEDWIKELQGLSLRNVTASIWVNGQCLAKEFGEMLFTHFGVSGPIILSLSNHVSKALEKDRQTDISLQINLKPALTTEVLDKRLQRDFEKFNRKQIKNALDELLPTKLIPVIIDLAFLDPEKWVHQITKTERQRLLEVLQALTFSIRGTRPLAEAIVTAGGVQVKEIDPKTMRSKLISNLYFAGEVIDIDGYTGGYNLQAAFSSGYVAGQAAAWQ